MSRRITPAEFVQKSLDLHLFFLRIMKEHSFFIEAALLPKNQDLIERADEFRIDFEKLLEQAVMLADGNVSRVVLNSGEVVTNKTILAEKQTQFLSGIPFDTALTQRELRLSSGRGDPRLERRIQEFNERVIRETQGLVELKTEILEGMLNCTLFTFNFPLLIEHIRREARFYIGHLQRLQRRIALDPRQELIAEKVFWDRIMAEHSLFIAHLLDPTEKALIRTADDFARRFFRLEDRAENVKKTCLCLPGQLLRDEINATRDIRDFKATANQLILQCRIRSIIIPLLADHVLREANHFLALLISGNIR
ncbi:MAG: DUF2935 domain-containing protein [Syntrophomonadaceae bacterium]|nr:DUF2935 domain-containing protein [Syntrophomonadaceae bacterium]